MADQELRELRLRVTEMDKRLKHLEKLLNAHLFPEGPGPDAPLEDDVKPGIGPIVTY